MAVDQSTVLDQGEIFWIDLPDQGGSEQRGRRPCIVMSRRLVNGGRTVVIVPMTTRKDKANAFRIAIPAQEIVRDVNSNSTIEDSVALCDHVHVIDKQKLQARLGKLSHTATIAVQLGLAYFFDIR